VMRLAALVSRLGGPDYRRWVSLREALRMATEGSARALGLDRCGRLEAGWHADLVVLDLSALPYVPLNDVITQLVLGENGAGVSAVLVAGRFVVRDRVLLTVDLDALRASSQEAADRLRDANAGRRRDFDALSDLVGHYCVGLASEPHPVHRYVGAPPA